MLSNLMYSLGASIENIDEDLEIEEVAERYKKNTERIGYALMVQALDMNLNWLPNAKEDNDGITKV